VSHFQHSTLPPSSVFKFSLIKVSEYAPPLPSKNHPEFPCDLSIALALQLNITDQKDSETSDQLVSIERLQFQDQSLAFDLDGAAGAVARVLIKKGRLGLKPNRPLSGLLRPPLEAAAL
jgi:hypothetical protein